jgi:hypothetical protein
MEEWKPAGIATHFCSRWQSGQGHASAALLPRMEPLLQLNWRIRRLQRRSWPSEECTSWMSLRRIRQGFLRCPARSIVSIARDLTCSAHLLYQRWSISVSSLDGVKWALKNLTKLTCDVWTLCQTVEQSRGPASL